MKATLATVAISVWPVAAQLKTGAFTKYFDYAGGLTVSGAVQIGEVAANHQVVFAELDGVDPECVGTQNGANNTCGIHIHAGTDCSADAGGHYWTDNFTSEDPWQPVTYTGASNSATKVEDVVVGTGTTLADLNGRVFIVHDSTGARVACAKLEMVATAVKSMKVEEFVKYPLTSGRDVTATVTVAQHAGDLQVLEFDIAGGDSACTPDAEVTAPNGCGIHIHSGTSCLHDQLVGGHLYQGSSDPWLKITYRTATTKGVTIPVATGLTGPAVYGRTVVIHDINGGRMACGRIVLAENVPLKTQQFVRYFDYSGDLDTEGVVSVGQAGTGTGGTQVLFATLNETDAVCDGTQTADPNVCGMHIHEGTDCSSDASGHYWNKADIATDPWINRYKTENESSEVSQVNLAIKTAFDLEDMENRVFVVHNSVGSGQRVACAQLKRVGVGATLTHDGDFAKYPGSSTSFSVSGQVGVYQSDASAQFLTYSLSGLDPGCTAVYPEPDNGCGIHIHAGTSCATNADVKDHHYDIGTDPWLKIRYVASSSDIFTGTTIRIETGIALSGLYGRALVVHDKDGSRIACTLIQSEAVVPPPAPTPAVTAAPTPGATPAPSPSGTPAPSGGVPGWAVVLIGIIVAGCCGAGGYFYMNQEGGYETQDDSGEGGEPEIEMQEQEEE